MRRKQHWGWDMFNYINTFSLFLFNGPIERDERKSSRYSVTHFVHSRVSYFEQQREKRPFKYLFDKMTNRKNSRGEKILSIN